MRVLWRSPGFTLAAVATLALGIGANTAIFSIVNAVLLRPLPTEGLDRLVVIRESLPYLNLHDVELAPAEVLDLAERTEVFAAVTGFRAGDRTLTGFGEPTRLAAVATLGDFTGVLGVRPYVGRFYGPEQSIEGPFDVAVISYGAWQQLSGGDPSFVGRTIELNDIPHEVIGVLPPEFRYPRQVQVWVPFRFTEFFQQPQGRGSLMMTTVARLWPGVTDPQLAAVLAAEVGRWNEEYHAGGQGKRLSSLAFVEHMAGPLRPILIVLMGAVLFVLLIAAANVGSLQLVRATGRAREIAVRSALGGGRPAIVRQLLLESLTLAALGGVAGLWLGTLALDLFARWEPARQMFLSETPLDATVLAFTALIALASAIAFGTIPALRATSVHPQQVLTDSARGSSMGARRHRLLQASVVVQVALALVLLIGCVLMVRTLGRLLATDPGFDAANVTTAQVAIPAASYSSPEARHAFFDALLERVRAQGGVEHAALVWGLPFTDQIDSSPIDIPGRPAAPGDPERHHEARMVSDGYFEAMRIPLLRGHGFDGTDRYGTRALAIVDQTFAEQFFPGEDPIGQQFNGYVGDAVTIIGVARRVDQHQVGDAPKASAYYSLRQHPWYTSRTLVVRSTLPVGVVANMLRAAIAELDTNVPLYDVQTMAGRVERSLGPRRLALLALGIFGTLALLLASIGVYGVMRYTMNQRTREIGIRVAVGAQPRDIIGMVVRQGGGLTLAGLVIGGVAAFWLSRLMSSILFGVSPRDPLAFIAAATTLGAVSLVAALLPARRATRVDPVAALRVE
jgi:putative ABC transport system permease protein